MFVVLIIQFPLNVNYFCIFAHILGATPLPFDRIFEFLAKAAGFSRGLFLFHKSSVGQSHTRRCDLSENRWQGDFMPVKSSCLDATLSGGEPAGCAQRPNANGRVDVFLSL